MSKHESPPFRMKVEGGRLVPSSAWDAERLATYRNGSSLSVQITQQKNRKLERKYWAILHEVIKSCPVKQRTAEDLHRALRLKLGVVDAFFTVDGKLRVDVKSTTTMDDPEYQRFYEEAMAELHKLTGVDPETLSAESADVGDDEHEPSEAAPLPADDAGGGDPGAASSDPAADLSEPASGGPAEADSIEERAEPGSLSASGSLSDEDRAWLTLIAKMLWAATGAGEQDVLKNQFDGARQHQTPATVGQFAREKGMSIYKKCKLVCFGEAAAADILKEIAIIAGCETKDIV